MNAREKKLAMIIGGLVLLFVLAMGFKRVVLQPVRDIETTTADYGSQLATLQKERQAFFTAEDRLKKLGARTFSDDLDLASARSGELLTELLRQSGLEEKNFTRLPIGPQKLRGAREIGWSVQGVGPFDAVINLLFLIETSPYLRHVENLTLTPRDATGQETKVNFRYWTLVLDPAPLVEFEELPPTETLDSDVRRRYDTIAQRNVLRPHVPQPPPPPPEPSPPPPTPPSEPGPETFRVVSLSTWKGESEVHVLDTTRGKTLRYKVGDELAGGKIVQVDYRPLELSENALVLSDSRVILRQGDEYWAIEDGRTLAEKFQLKNEWLPPNLAGP